MGRQSHRADLLWVRRRRAVWRGSELLVLLALAALVLLVPSAAAAASAPGGAAAGLNVRPAGAALTEPGAPLPFSPVAAGASRASSTTIFSDGSEGATSPWTVEGDPTWAITTYRASAGSRSSYCAGSGVNPPGPYVNNMSAWRIAGPFDLTGLTSATFQFKTWLDTELDHDYLRALVSLDGQNYYGWQQSGRSGGWITVTHDLTDVPTLGSVCGKSGVYIAFRFLSDAAVVAEGAYVDDVSVTGSGGGGGTPELALVLAPDVQTVPYAGTAGLEGAMLDVNSGFLVPNYEVGLYWTQEDSITSTLYLLDVFQSTSGDYPMGASNIQRLTYFVMKYPSDADSPGMFSNLVKVKAHALVSPPSIPSSIPANVLYTAWGSLRPQHTASQNRSSHTRVYAEHYLGGKWQKVVSLYAQKYRNVGDGDDAQTLYGFSLRYKPGKWRVRAVHTDSDHVKSTSSWRTFSAR